MRRESVKADSNQTRDMRAAGALACFCIICTQRANSTRPKGSAGIPARRGEGYTRACATRRPLAGLPRAPLPVIAKRAAHQSHVRITALRVTCAFPILPLLFSFSLSPSLPLSRSIVFAVSNMVNWKLSSLLLLSLRALGSFAAEVPSRALLRDINPLTPAPG